MSLSVRSLFGLLVVGLLLLSGCGSSGRVTGEVTYEGKTIENGLISFLPADGDGPSAGATIEKGRYTALKVPPGQKIVRIEAFAVQADKKTSAERAKDAASGLRGGGSPIRLIPPGADGNDAKIEVKEGDQTRDFHLKKPVGKSK